MRSLYANPLRVYLLLGLCALAGIFSGTQLSVSLFPQSSKPVIYANIPLEDLPPRDFLKNYGLNFESEMLALQKANLKVTDVIATYNPDSVSYEIRFEWQSDPAEARREVENSVQKITLQLSESARRNSYVYENQENGGFFAASLSNPELTPDELFLKLDPLLTPRLRQINDAQQMVLWNPKEKSVIINLKPEALLRHQLLPIDIQRALFRSLQSYKGGRISLSGKSLQVIIPSAIETPQDMERIQIVSSKGITLQLGDVAHIEHAVAEDKMRIIKTNGVSALMVFGQPKVGGNIKEMSEQAISLLQELESSFPTGTEMKILVDPSQFIRNAISHVLKEVFLAAGLAVLVLFLFIGQIKNVVTAAIEIPLSIILAFILMKIFDINLNLISLGGLALSAGMNVDASVVVMENIFRYFEKVKGRLTDSERLDLVMKAVNEVKMPIIASTIASVVVFLPLIFTQGLSSALLGDLAKAVVFSHSLSAVVALILVPTVRLQMMKTETHFHPHSPLENQFRFLENAYTNTLSKFLSSTKTQLVSLGGLFILLLLLITFLLPQIPKEVIGKPVTDWMIILVRNNQNSMIRQMESHTEEIETQVMDLLKDDLNYTFTQINSPNASHIMVRLKNKKRVPAVKKILEDNLTDTPTTRFIVIEWNPSELPLPDMNALEISIGGSDEAEIQTVTEKIKTLIQEKEFFPRLYSEPDLAHRENILLKPKTEIWSELAKTDFQRPVSDISDYLQIATTARTVGYINIDNRLNRISMKYPEGYVSDPQTLGALPLSIKDKIIPIKALMDVEIQPALPTLYRVNLSSKYTMIGNVKEEDKSKRFELVEATQKSVNDWRLQNLDHADINITFEDGEKEINDSIHQLGIAFGLSLLLIFVTMVLQMGRVINSLLVLVSIPLGFIGVIVGLYVFQSTVSLNSMLGLILLNGIAVANSIILVDFMQKLTEQGFAPREAALEAGKARLRPILMTTLTTLLGMTPLALGLGEGGKILQPLGISVITGLGVSTFLTLFVVPTLQCQYLLFKERRISRETA